MVVNMFTNFNLIHFIIITLWLLRDTSLQSRPKINFCDEAYACKVNGTKVQHTICTLGHKCGEGPNCKNFKHVPLSENEKESILDAHNFYRNKIATGQGERSLDGKSLPKAADMRELVWDHELEFSAQCWANQCPEGHDKCRTKSDGPSVGQNLVFSTENDVLGMIRSFYNEVAAFSLANITEYSKSSHKADRFVKMIWSNSSQLGCARSSYDIGILGSRHGYVIVCHYSWGENSSMLPVYKKGEVCTACPKHSDCHRKYAGLCTTRPSTAEEPDICPYSTDYDCAPLFEKKSERKLKRIPRANSDPTQKTSSPKESTKKRTSGWPNKQHEEGTTKKPKTSAKLSTTKKPKTSAKLRPSNTKLTTKSVGFIISTPLRDPTVIIERKIILIAGAPGTARNWIEKCLSVVYSLYCFILLFCNKII